MGDPSRGEAVYDAGDFNRNPFHEKAPTLMLIVCWNCKHLETKTGQYTSHGPKCLRCGDRTETFKVIG